MSLRDEANAAIKRAKELRVTTAAAFLSSVQTELAVARSMCNLAQHEDGEARIHHVKEAQAAFKAALELAQRVALTEELRLLIEAVRVDIAALVKELDGGR